MRRGRVCDWEPGEGGRQAGREGGGADPRGGEEEERGAARHTRTLLPLAWAFLWTLKNNNTRGQGVRLRFWLFRALTREAFLASQLLELPGGTAVGLEMPLQQVG